MDVNTILTQLIQRNQCLPAMKLAWNCQLDLPDWVEVPKISPSHYIREIELSTEERHSLLSRQHKGIWRPGFELIVTPSIVVFQKYKAGDKLTVTLNIRNISKTLQRIQLLMDETDVFSLDWKSTRIAKFAPGMIISARVIFTPEDDKDYFHKLLIGTKSSTITIPIVGIGGRAILDLPDKIDFGVVPVKYLKQKTLIVCNTGSKYAKFTLNTEGPFSVSPEKGILAPNDSFSITVSYFSCITETSEGFLCVKFDNGEEIFSRLEAQSDNISAIYISPDNSIVKFPNTYFGLRSKEMITLVNRTDCIAHFTWKKFSAGISPESRMSGLSMYHVIHKSIDAGHRSSTSLKINESLQMDPVLKPEPLFNDSCFIIEPLTGDIQPQSSTDVHIVFSPRDPGSFEATVFCDITGHEERLQLCFEGKSIGPKFRFGFDSLDVGDVYLGGRHSYEIPLTNTSDIKGTILFAGISGIMPKINMKVEPRKISLTPGAFNAFYADFTCTGSPGRFLEEVKFRVQSTDEVYSVLVRGTITLPRLHFSTRVIEFGQTSFGFPAVEEIILFNDTLNCVDVNLRMDEDGVESALDYEGIIASFDDDNTVSIPMNPKEFNIEPAVFQLQPKGLQKITITLLCNNYGEYRRKLLVRVGNDSNDAPVLVLPVFAECSAPELTNAKPEFTLHNLCIGLPTSNEFHIENSNMRQGIYCIIPKESPKVILSSDKFVGVLNSNGTTVVPIKITCFSNNECVASAELYLAGREEKVMDLDLICTGAFCKVSSTDAVVSQHSSEGSPKKSISPAHVGSANKNKVSIIIKGHMNMKCPPGYVLVRKKKVPEPEPLPPPPSVSVSKESRRSKPKDLADRTSNIPKFHTVGTGKLSVTSRQLWQAQVN